MSTLEDLDDLEREEKEKKDEDKKDDDRKKSGGDTEMEDAENDKADEDDLLDDEILSLSTRDIQARRRLLENDLRVMKSEFQRLTHEKATMNDKIKDNVEKIENNR
jgi:26S proteasome regulatory subunit T5